MSESRRPLEGVKCVCVAIFQQLPAAISMMADLGAEIINIERPGGRVRGGRGMAIVPGIPLSPYFETNNRGFKSLTLDIQKEKGLEILYKLVKDADVFAENLRPGTNKRHHFGYDDLVKVNPGIIYLSASSYGPDGPSSMLGGMDAVGQALGGVASTFGEEGSRMMTSQVSIADETSAMTNFGAIMVGLYHKKMTGEGQKIETSLLGSQIRLMGFSMTRVMFAGENLQRGRGRISGGVVPNLSASFNDKNGKPFTFQIVGEDTWQKSMKAAGFEKKLAEAGCAKLGDVANSKEKQAKFFETMDKLFATSTREELIKTLRRFDIICAPINTLLEASVDPDVLANNYVIEVNHPKVGKIKEVGFPWKFSKTPPKAGIAPELGEHTNEVLTKLGYSKVEITELNKQGVI